jgi:hypothetical protein
MRLREKGHRKAPLRRQLDPGEGIEGEHRFQFFDRSQARRRRPAERLLQVPLDPSPERIPINLR